MLILQHAVARDYYCKSGVFKFIKTGSDKCKCCLSGFYRGGWDLWESPSVIIKMCKGVRFQILKCYAKDGHTSLLSFTFESVWKTLLLRQVSVI